MDTTWIYLAVLSAVLTSLRHLYIKRWCRDVAAELIVCSTRLFGTFFLVLVIPVNTIHIHDIPAFTFMTTITVILTAIATIIQIRVIQQEALSRSVPYLSFIPLFMIPWTALLYHEVPGMVSLGGIVMTCCGAYLLNARRTMSPALLITSIFTTRSSALMLVVSLMLGLTTACDKIAIGASTAFSYTFIWTISSAVVMLATVWRRLRVGGIASVCNPHLFVQALLWIGAFLSQMLGVQHAIAIPSGVTYVKLITMLNILFTVGLAGAFLKEKNILKSLSASALMVGGAAVAIMTAFK